MGKWKDTWCDCDFAPNEEENVEDFIKRSTGMIPDGLCSCGVYKHHVHCKDCGGITQVG